jgi:hypothetical protein
VRSAVTRAAKANAMYTRAIASARVTRSSSVVVEMAELVIIAKLKMVEERRH